MAAVILGTEEPAGEETAKASVLEELDECTPYFEKHSGQGRAGWTEMTGLKVKMDEGDGLVNRQCKSS